MGQALDVDGLDAQLTLQGQQQARLLSHHTIDDLGKFLRALANSSGTWGMSAR
jgi:hypothetical protein